MQIFAAFISGMVKRVKVPVDREVKTKNPVAKVTQHLICLTNPGTARQLLLSDMVLLKCVLWETTYRVKSASNHCFAKLLIVWIVCLNETRKVINLRSR